MVGFGLSGLRRAACALRMRSLANPKKKVCECQGLFHWGSNCIGCDDCNGGAGHRCCEASGGVLASTSSSLAEQCAVQLASGQAQYACCHLFLGLGYLI